MKSSRIAFIFTAVLIIVNVVFLYGIVAYKDLISIQLTPGLTLGIVGFATVITFAVLLTWVYVSIINQRDNNRG